MYSFWYKWQVVNGLCVDLAEAVEEPVANLSLFCLPHQDTDAGGIDWGDSEAAPIVIEVVDAGTDCKYLFIYFFIHHYAFQSNK